MKNSFALSLAAVALVLAGCSSEKPGTPIPAPISPPVQSQVSGSAPAGGGVDTTSIDPCSLISAADLASYGTFNAPEAKEEGGARRCVLTRERATASEDSLLVGVGIRDSQGVDSVNDNGKGKTIGNVNGRKAVLVPFSATTCLMALEVTPTSRVDVSIVANDSKQSCEAVEKVADIVEPRLPKG